MNKIRNFKPAGTVVQVQRVGTQDPSSFVETIRKSVYVDGMSPVYPSPGKVSFIDGDFVITLDESDLRSTIDE